MSTPQVGAIRLSPLWDQTTLFVGVVFGFAYFPPLGILGRMMTIRFVRCAPYPVAGFIEDQFATY